MGDDKNDKCIMRLDGSHGVGIAAHLTIITADKIMGTKDTTYEFPFGLIDFETLQKSLVGNLILGYRVEKIIPSDQKCLVITKGPDGLRTEYEGEEDQ